ncbi:DUF2059 domain-containing protein [Mesonia aestuariivivens]|uniref:DUF2059 domain-containing protein n=1 Tax=Mesonia aestuariivivens TaxID=2796128 RepID=A0ABS6W0T8_9FLAO|nr:DUF2059 domain-containing protein [Mesonia aestuariivivens]MBW2961369.1 DUF2059 domain-containing protein [Mesonia aestuariivivens]
MKKYLVAIALVSISFAGFAQEDAEFKKEMLNFVEIQSGSSIDAALSQVMPMIPEGDRETFKKELNAEMKGMYDDITNIYIEKVGKEDLQEMLDFYETTAGKNILAKTPDVIEASMGLTQKYMVKIQPIIQKYMQR